MRYERLRYRDWLVLRALDDQATCINLLPVSTPAANNGYVD